LDKAIPVGAFVIGSKVTIVTGFTGDTTAVLTIGKTAGEDEFTDGTNVNVLAAGIVGDSVEDPMEFIASATDVVCQITGASDFGLITAGKMLVEVFYMSTNPELVEDYPNKALI
jgi:hypothetical protein